MSAPRSRRLEAETIDRLVAEYVDGTTAAEVGRRYGVAKSSVLQLVRPAGRQVRQPRLSISQTAQLVALYQAGLSQTDIVARLDKPERDMALSPPRRIGWPQQ